MPESIFADIETGKYNDFDVEDEATIFMKYPDMTGIFIISTGEPCGGNRFEIIGTRGRITIINEEIEYIKYEDSRSYINTADVNTGEKLEHSIEKIDIKDDTDPYIIMFNNYADHIEKGIPLIADGKSGLNALKLCAEAYKYR